VKDVKDRSEGRKEGSEGIGGRKEGRKKVK
jgi:hypothetical protein